MEVCPGDIVMRMAPPPPEPRRKRSGLRQYETYEVTDSRGELFRLSGLRGWWTLRGFDVVLHEPCA